MKSIHRFLLTSIVGLIAVPYFSLAIADDPDTKPGAATETPPGVTTPSTAEVEDDVPRVSLEVARDRAELMQEIYKTTLDVMHHRYFHVDRAVIPARAMEDVFKSMERRNHVQSRWISASFRAMSVDHEPKTDFEKQASRRIARGEALVETIEDGYYRRAGGIPFTAGCVSCHSGLFGSTSPARKFAGLIISIPVDKTAQLSSNDKPSKP